MKETFIAPRFYCEECKTSTGCSYYNFGVLCEEELKFKNNIMETFYSKIDKRLKELEKEKKQLLKNSFFKLGISLKLKVINEKIKELNNLLK